MPTAFAAAGTNRHLAAKSCEIPTTNSDSYAVGSELSVSTGQVIGTTNNWRKTIDTVTAIINDIT